MGKRVIVYGDIHGCLDELRALRERIGIRPDDIEISVGDILNKGPYLAHEMISYVRAHAIHTVMGNNEAKALKQYKKYKKEGESYLQERLRPFESATVLSLRPEDAAWLQKLPYFLKFENLTILHAGLLPGRILCEEMNEAQRKELTLIRYLNKELQPIPWHDEAHRYAFWSELYDGREGFIVAGHHPFPEPKIESHAIDIDTGCVYGGKLTAALFEHTGKGYDTEGVRFVTEEAREDYWNGYLSGEAVR